MLRPFSGERTFQGLWGTHIQAAGVCTFGPLGYALSGLWWAHIQASGARTFKSPGTRVQVFGERTIRPQGSAIFGLCSLYDAVTYDG